MNTELERNLKILVTKKNKDKLQKDKILTNINIMGIDGTMPNNGTLTYTPSTSQQTIPAGYTSGGTIESIENSTEYQTCLSLTEDILE